MPTMYMPVTDDAYELPLAPPMPSRACVARWGGLTEAKGKNAGVSMGFLIAVYMGLSS